MRIYFLSCKPAVLKLNGEFVGRVDQFERFTELKLSDGTLAEIVPDGNLQPLNFFINESLLAAPPSFLDVYLTEGEALLYVREYGSKNSRLEVLYQTRFYGNLITIFSQGGQFLSVEGENYQLIPLPDRFTSVTTTEERLGGYPVLAVRGGGVLLLISEHGKRIFMNEVESAQIGTVLEATVAFRTCTAAKAVCVYAYDGEELTLVKSKTVETCPPATDILHFAFFESILTRGNYCDYLCDGLKPKGELLKEYLGEYVGVTTPSGSFYSRHGDIKAAGLIYPKAVNLFEVKYFAVDCADGKISNVYPVE